MINIKFKENCVGCNACVQRCPKHCISMHADEQGFIYPKVNTEICINCGLCEKVCPVINQDEHNKPSVVYAAWNSDDNIRLKSSSGGIFYEIAKYIINQGGIVFGAKYDKKWNVIHSYATTLDDVQNFIGSKYVQSYIGDTFLMVQKFLKDGKKVLFSGTPCHIAALRHFLKWSPKVSTELLVTVDFACHGTPSPKIWQNYLQNMLHKTNPLECQPILANSDGELSKIANISFRDKRLGWMKFGLSISIANSKNEEAKLIFEPFTENLYIQGFIKNLYLRPSCYKCPAKYGKSHSDITLADFWSIKNLHPELFSNNGVSCVLINTDNGKKLIDDLCIEKHLVSYNDALNGNPAIEHSAKKPKQYFEFWKRYQQEGLQIVPDLISKMRMPFYEKASILCKNMISATMRTLLGNDSIDKIKNLIRKSAK